MGTTFPTLLLGDVIRFANGKAIKPGGQGSYPVYGSNGIIGQCDEFRHANGVIIGRVGAYCGSVAYCPKRFWSSDNTLVAFPASDDFDMKFLFYLLHNAKLSRYAGGAAQPLVTQTVLKQVEVQVPPLPVQRRIAGILSAYDDLIENNLRRIRILEEMARALYREWFVHFRFPGHEAVPRVDSPHAPIPEGWEVKKLSEFTATQYGYTESSNAEPVGPKYLRGMDINKTSYIDWSQVPYCPIAPEDQEVYLLNKGDVVVIRMADPGKVGIIEEEVEAVFASYLIRVRPNSERMSPYFLFHLLDSLEYQNYVSGASTGTTRKSASAGVITDYQFALPPKNLVADFEKRATSIRGMLTTLLRKTQNLRRTRDLLLPRLLSGEVELSGLEEEAPASSNPPSPVSARSAMANGSAARAQMRPVSPEPEKSLRAAEEPPRYPADRPKAGESRLPEEPEEPAAFRTQDIELYETDEVMAAFRQAARAQGEMTREQLLKEVSLLLGYQRLGPKIEEVLRGHLRAAIRRRIISANAADAWLETPTMGSYTRDELVATFTSVMRPGTRYEREDILRATANYLGFRRLTETTRTPLKSAINSAIRQGTLGYEGSLIWREK